MVPMEKRHIYDQFYTPSLYKAEFDAKPMVLFLGQVVVNNQSNIEHRTCNSHVSYWFYEAGR